MQVSLTRPHGREENVPAIVEMTHSSQEEGAGLADVLFGDYNPAGRLTETWVASMDQLPPMMDYDIRHGRTYMYLKQKPLYAFGYGLSYTTFRYSNLKLNSETLNGDGELASASTFATPAKGPATRLCKCMLPTWVRRWSGHRGTERIRANSSRRGRDKNRHPPPARRNPALLGCGRRVLGTGAGPGRDSCGRGVGRHPCSANHSCRSISRRA